MALSISTALATYIVSLCLILQISITEAENVSVSFELDGDKRVRLDGDAVVMDGNVIQLTNSTNGLGGGSAGRVVYGDTIPLWNASSKSFVNFITHFQFQINWTPIIYADKGGSGIAFFMASPQSGYDVEYRADGGYLGLFNSKNNGKLSNQLVAVEFDTYQSPWDENANHMGIDVNNITSEAAVRLNQSLKNNKIWKARINYHGKENKLEVSAGSEGQVPNYLSYEINLTKYLPEYVVVGFSAAAYKSSEIHRLISWNFTSVESGSSEIQSSGKRKISGKKKTSWKVGMTIGSSVLVAVLFVSFAIFLYTRRNRETMKEEQKHEIELPLHHDPRPSN